VKGRVLRAKNRWAEAVPEFERALSLDGNLLWALHFLAQCKLFAGSLEEVIPLEEQAIRLSPRDPRIGWWYFMIGIVHLLQTRTDEAIKWFEKARSASPGLPYVHAHLAAAYALKGETEPAATSLAEGRRLSADNRYSSIAALKATLDLGVPKVRALFEATYFAGLRKAGMPEE
jgi:adenylate cyclase